MVFAFVVNRCVNSELSQNQTTDYRAFARIRTRFSNKHPGFLVRIGFSCKQGDPDWKFRA